MPRMWLTPGMAYGRKNAAPILFINTQGKGVLVNFGCFYVDGESILIKNKLTNYNIILNYTSVTV